MYTIEATPDPRTIKVRVDRPVVDRGRQAFESPIMAAFSPLASALFKVPGIGRVELAPNTLLLTKAAGSEWETIRPELEKTLAYYFG